VLSTTGPCTSSRSLLAPGSPATATAETPVSLLILGQREFNSLLNEFPDIRSSVLLALAQRVRRLENTAD